MNLYSLGDNANPRGLKPSFHMIAHDRRIADLHHMKKVERIGKILCKQQFFRSIVTRLVLERVRDRMRARLGTGSDENRYRTHFLNLFPFVYTHSSLLGSGPCKVLRVSYGVRPTTGRNARKNYPEPSERSG